ncbi:unnamed protein product [Vitrella brassicaformis CCMP3155]|uniref:Transmembrane protein n=1 Tax=Vitrella brassicaformis (strain CCMP3155) TaxID=1169540 RepID=A0A0G4E8K2_VITBC|nr:unnamed protein product [Vitrella brassicaformis CCMP3155]|eukprot:CEL92124.1 unnamed protein product [Vitrella brassicaformis CCMP3155]
MAEATGGMAPPSGNIIWQCVCWVVVVVYCVLLVPATVLAKRVLPMYHTEHYVKTARDFVAWFNLVLLPVNIAVFTLVSIVWSWWCLILPVVFIVIAVVTRR